MTRKTAADYLAGAYEADVPGSEIAKLIREGAAGSVSINIAKAAILLAIDAEAAAMRERADKVFTECVVDQSRRTGTLPRDFQSPGQWRDATRRAAIRALPATGEVGRG